MDRRDYLAFLREASEVLSLPYGENPDQSLEKIVALVRSHIRTDVASVYLFNKGTGELVLWATQGLAPESVGQVRLRLGEGLVGHVMETLEPICEKRASDNPRWKPIAGINEESYESFLAVPLRRGAERLGVLVTQRRDADYFEARDVLALEALASQLATAMENGRWRSKALAQRRVSQPLMIRGKALSPGYACAPVVHLNSVPAVCQLTSSPFAQRRTAADLERALTATWNDLMELERSLESRIPEVAAFLFTAHQMMLMDPQFGGAIRARVERGENAPDAVVAVAQECVEYFAAHPDPYVQDKSTDIEDVAVRLLGHLVGVERPGHQAQGTHVVIAPNLYPSDVVQMYAQGVQGVILGHGGDTSHVVLLLRSLGIPSVIVDPTAVADLAEGTLVLLDAQDGEIHIAPPEAVIRHFQDHWANAAVSPPVPIKPQTHTQDGTRVYLLANVNLLGEAALAHTLNAEGVGLYRSELPVLMRSAFPSEEEQVVVYKRLFREMQGRPVTVRTLDIGGDKEIRHPLREREDNPQLGLRSIRFTLRYPKLFHEQLRAILRGATGASILRIMFPMIGGVEELRRAKVALHSALASLAQDGLPHFERPSVGIMVELPSTVVMLPELAREVDFFSIGANDLVQYLLGVDRGNCQVVDYYRPEHPAVLRTLHRIVQIARRHDREVSVCGEIAHELRFIPFLLGIGVRHFSLDPRYLPQVQAAVEAVDLAEARNLVARLLRCADLGAVRRMLDSGI
jgi:phosphotransferase system, enzyme I, PtsP